MLAIFAVLAIGSTALGVYTNTLDSYTSHITYSVTKLPAQYDYSCLQSIQGLYLVLTNNGDKTVSGFSVSVSNPLCKGALPPLPTLFDPGTTLKFYIYSTAMNGSITITGNNTLLVIKF